ncbi:hypothetical protein [Chitiniphilus eburneus]|uniref:Uncharacterized protein n=1 Tax=Chitiniphilus eburneus TaxID=2571148 RepID=A0A4U0QBK4_9NEIS|nr:hypothetical protein [Chitiniphilus eburneus]TJZ78739.1 hypothetical protein FAZ21_00140 [Chitiniphilus eburneus]
MNLYEIIRWGNDTPDPFNGGPDGQDTCFLVRAQSLEHAAVLADAQLARQPSTRVAAWAQAAYLLGIDCGSDTSARVLRGPYLQHAYRHGWRHWHRDAAEEAWVEQGE